MTDLTWNNFLLFFFVFFCVAYGFQKWQDRATKDLERIEYHLRFLAWQLMSGRGPWWSFFFQAAQNLGSNPHPGSQWINNLFIHVYEGANTDLHKLHCKKGGGVTQPIPNT